MIGPVISLEVQRGWRRGHLNLLRRVYAGWLVLQFTVLFVGFVYGGSIGPDPTAGWVFTRAFSRWVNSYLELFVVQHFVLILLATPALVAGAVAEDKARGALQHLLLADVSSWEVIAGKLLGRVTQVGLVALAGLPMIALVGGYGHLNRATILALFAVSVAPLFALGAVSILASVWSLRARDAVLKVYVWLAVGFVAVWAVRHYVAVTIAPQVAYSLPLSRSDAALWRLDQLLACLNPAYVLQPSWESSQPELTGDRLLLASAVWGAIGVICLALAIGRLRPAYFRQLAAAGRRRDGRAPTRPAVTDDALRWKEYEIEGLSIFPRFRRLPRWLMMAVIVLTTLALSSRIGLIGLGLLGLLAFSFAAAIRSSGAISGEREQQTWDLLLLTPLEPREIVRGKFRGICDSHRPYLGAFAVATLTLTVFQLDRNEIVGICVLLVFADVSAQLMSAMGLFWSAQCRTSWRSLLLTLVAGYACLLVTSFGGSLIVWGIAVPVSLGLLASTSFDAASLLLGVLVAVGFGSCMYWFNRIIAETYLDKAAKWIAVRERMWSDDNRLLFLEGEFRRLSEARDRSERGVSAP